MAICKPVEGRCPICLLSLDPLGERVGGPLTKLPKPKQPSKKRPAGSGKGARRRKRLIAAKGGRCAFCGTTKKLTLDHIVPLSKGGKRGLPNLQVLCRPCNNAKGDQLDYQPEAVAA